MKFTYNFPRIRTDNTTYEQLDKIADELLEAVDAMEEDEVRQIEELLDVAHAVETALRQHNKKLVDKVYVQVLSKNCEREYYA